MLKLVFVCGIQSKNSDGIIVDKEIFWNIRGLTAWYVGIRSRPFSNARGDIVGKPVHGSDIDIYSTETQQARAKDFANTKAQKSKVLARWGVSKP